MKIAYNRITGQFSPIKSGANEKALRDAIVSVLGENAPMTEYGDGTVEVEIPDSTKPLEVETIKAQLKSAVDLLS